jgi:hypothetical protein
MHSPDVKPSKMVSDFFHVTLSEQVGQFKNYSLDEQYELYIFGNQVVHPAASYLARPFAEQGPVIVPFLKEKLEAAEEATVRDIIVILAELAYLKLYDFSKDQELMTLMDQRAANMQGIWKETTLEMISEIRSVH